MKTVAYLRVSTGGQDMASQKLAILDYARRHRFTVARFVEAQLSSRRARQREQIFQTIEALPAGDRLAVSELSLLGRRAQRPSRSGWTRIVAKAGRPDLARYRNAVRRCLEAIPNERVDFERR